MKNPGISIFVLSIAAILTASCGFDAKTITGSGNVVTSNRIITDEFTGVEAEKGLDVVVEQSSDRSVRVEADDNLQEHIHTKVSNGVLKITSDFGNYRNVASKKIFVRMPQIRKLVSSSGADISSANTLHGESISLTASSGSSIEANLEVEDVACETSSGSTIKVAGKAIKLHTESSSGSTIDADELLVNDVYAESSSGSSTEVHPVVSLKAKASSGSSIDYQGDPEKVNKKASSGGSVTGE